MDHMPAWPLATTAQNPSATSPDDAEVAMRSRRLSILSARTPAGAPKRSIGRNCNAMTMPSWSLRLVRSRTSQVTASAWVHDPTLEMIWPMK